MKPHEAESLRLAEHTRLARSVARRKVIDGGSVIAALAEPCVGSARLSKVLAWQRQWGEQRAEKLLESLGIGCSLLVREVTGRQVAALASALALERKD